jgi:mitochondrial Rho GTPase 1
LLEKYRNHIWACYECSAKTQRGVIEVFHIAQHVVVYPNGPLYDPNTCNLTVKCANALRRIFRFFDQDCDGLLNEKEINKFQLHCFEVPMDPDEFSALNKVIMKDTGGGGVRPVRGGGGGSGVTLEGFMCIIRIFVKKDKFEVYLFFSFFFLSFFHSDTNIL